MTPGQPVVSGSRLIQALEQRKGTLAGILRDASLSADELRRLL